MNNLIKENPEYKKIIERIHTSELLKIWSDIVLGDKFSEWGCEFYEEISSHYDSDVSWKSYQPCFIWGIKRANGAKCPVLSWWNQEDGYVCPRDWRHGEIYTHRILQGLPVKGNLMDYYRESKNALAERNWFRPD